MSIFSSLIRHPKFDFTGNTDWHSHILPGVDDGIQSFDDSLAVLRQYEQMGIKRVWLTPHVMEDVPNAPATLRCRMDELRDKYNGTIDLRLASEHMVDNLFSERLAANNLLPIGENSDMLLIETSYFSAPLGFDDTIERIREAGYTPMLAHPERYNYISSMAEYTRLANNGVRFQLNLLSLCGYYGAQAKDKAQRLLMDDMYYAWGTDIHSPRQLPILQGLDLGRKLRMKLESISERIK